MTALVALVLALGIYLTTFGIVALVAYVMDRTGT